MLNSQAKGRSMSTPSTAIKAMIVRSIQRCAGFGLHGSIPDPSSRGEKLNGCDDQDDQGHNDRDGSGVADLEVVKGFFNDVDRHGARGVPWAASGQDDDRFVDLQRADRGINDGEEDDRRDPRQNDAEESAPIGRAVHDRSVHDRLRHTLQSRDEEDHEEAGILPNVHDDDRHHSRVARCQPVDRSEAEPDQVVVDDSEIVAVEITPYDRDEGGGYDHRQEIGEAEQIEEERGHRAIESEREEESDNDVSRHREDREAQGVPKNLKRAIAGEEALKILQSHPARPGHRIVVSEAKHEGHDDWRQYKNGIEREAWQYEKVTGTRLRLLEVGFSPRDRSLHCTCA